MLDQARKLIQEIYELKSTPNIEQLAKSRLKKLEQILLGIGQREIFLNEVLDHLRIGVIIVDVMGQPFISNRYAEKILETDEGLSIRQNRLQGATKAETRNLHQLLKAVVSDDKTTKRRNGGVITLRRHSDPMPLLAWVAPLGRVVEFNEDHVSAAVIFVADPRQEIVVDENKLLGVFGLTRVQAQIAARLLTGKRLDKVARSLGISTSTARGHLKQVFSKTNTDRQVELFQLLSSLFGNVRVDH